MVQQTHGSGEVTALLKRAEGGDEEALERIFPLVYRELQRIARAQLGRERANHTLQPTALVNEAYLKLVQRPPRGTENRSHFLGVAARAMRQILVDHARAWSASKRGGGTTPVTLHEELAGIATQPEDLLALDQALDRLEVLDPRLKQVVELRYFAGLQDEEVAGVLGVTRRTVQRDWVKARAWLHRELADEAGPDAADAVPPGADEAASPGATGAAGGE